ncbi:MAG TPA: hypothetical protein VJO13_00440 [Ktedonobacterales bacterium]|nr:hypothetical protein [Ktedonobacterales bacterium]
MRWIAGGIAGWLAAMAPLLGVNIAGYANVFDSNTAVIAGAAALLGSILLGGLVTGLIAGRSSSTRVGGALATLPAGILAAFLYIISLITVVMVAIRVGAAPTVVAEHPLRISGAVVCLGAILLGMSLLVGVLTGKRTVRETSQAQGRSSVQRGIARPGQPGYGGQPSQPSRGTYPGANVSYPSGREDYESQRRGYGGYDERQPVRYPPGSSPRQGGGSVGRDGDWRDGRS